MHTTHTKTKIDMRQPGMDKKKPRSLFLGDVWYAYPLPSIFPTKRRERERVTCIETGRSGLWCSLRGNEPGQRLKLIRPNLSKLYFVKAVKPILPICYQFLFSCQARYHLQTRLLHGASSSQNLFHQERGRSACDKTSLAVLPKPFSRFKRLIKAPRQMLLKSCLPSPIALLTSVEVIAVFQV